MLDISETELHLLEESAKSILIVVGKIKKRNNAKASVAKAKANGSFLGRNKKRDDKLIAALRKTGMSIRAIAARTGVSSTAVHRSLK